jgi:hypothetical protein
VDHGLDRTALQRLAQCDGIEQISVDEGRAGHDGAAMPFDKIVEDNYLMPVVYQFFSDDTADVPCASGNKHTHATNLQERQIKCETIELLFLKSVLEDCRTA